MFSTASELLFPPPGPTPDFLEYHSFPHDDLQAVIRLERKIIPWLQNSNEHQPSRSREVHAQNTLKSAESYLRRSAPTSTKSFGNGRAAKSEIERQIRQLVDWATINDRLIDPSLAQQPDFEIGGVEHDVFHDGVTGRWLKITKPGKCGKAHYACDTDIPDVPSTIVLEDAFPADYLERLRLSNTNFGDNLCLHGVIKDRAGPRLVISQRHVPGDPATTDQIIRYFKDMGFVLYKDKTFYSKKENLLISDAHSGNMLRPMPGVIVAIDMIVQRPTGALRSSVMTPDTLSFEDETEPALISQ